MFLELPETAARRKLVGAKSCVVVPRFHQSLNLVDGKFTDSSEEIKSARKLPAMNAKVVVIGATGHIGSYLIPQLVARSFDVYVVSRVIRYI